MPVDNVNNNSGNPADWFNQAKNDSEMVRVRLAQIRAIIAAFGVTPDTLNQVKELMNSIRSIELDIEGVCSDLLTIQNPDTNVKYLIQDINTWGIGERELDIAFDQLTPQSTSWGDMGAGVEDLDCWAKATGDQASKGP